MVDRRAARLRACLALAVAVAALGGGIAVALPGATGVGAPRPRGRGGERIVARQAGSPLRHAGGDSALVARGDRQPLRSRPQRIGVGHVRKPGRRRGPAGPAGPRGPEGPPGPPGPQLASSLTVNWLGLENAPGHDSASGLLPGVGTLVAQCNATAQTLTLLPAGGQGRTVLDVTVFQGEGTEGASSNQRLYTDLGAPLSIALPNNGMISAVASVEPLAGDGGVLAAPATLLLSSEWKVNDPDPARNYCYLAAQALQQQ